MIHQHHEQAPGVFALSSQPFGAGPRPQPSDVAHARHPTEESRSAKPAPAGGDPLLAGIDIGTTNIKATIYDLRGRNVAQASVPTITHYPRPLWAYFDPGEIWDQVTRVLREATGQVDDSRRIVSVAVTSMGEAGLPLDAENEPTYNIIAWYDRRTIAQCDWLKETIGEERLFEVTGLAVQPIFSLCKILWIKETQPEVWNRTVRWLMVADYIAFRLCGAQATDYSLASRSLAFNIRKLTWDESLLADVDVPPSLFPPPVPSGTALGTVTPEAAAATGLAPSTIVAAGGHDHVCGALAAGVVRKGQMLDSMGTAEALFLPLEQPIADPRMGQQGYSQGAHVVPGKYYVFGGIFTSGGSVEWLRDVSGHIDYGTLIAEARQVPPGSNGAIFTPHLRLGSPPHPDPRARAAFLGLSSDTTRGALLRAVLEGLAYDARAILEPLLGFAGLNDMPDISVIGGSSRNDLLMEIKASVLETAHRVIDLEEATSLGAALLGGIAAGVYRDAADACAQMEMHPRTIEPDAEAAAFYQECFTRVYQQIFDALQPLHRELHDLVVDRDPTKSDPSGSRHTNG